MSDLPKLVFLHMPKAAGKTFRMSILEKLYGEELIIERLDHKNLNDIILYNNISVKFRYPKDVETYKVVCGHFKASKYLYLNRPMVTWIRNPTDRTISHYYYWKRYIKTLDPKVQIMYAEGMDLVDFSKLFGNYMSHLMDIDINTFKFVGISEQFNLGLKKFEKLFDLKVDYKNQQLNKGSYNKVSVDIRNEMTKNQKQDFDLYEKAIEIFKGI